MGNRADFGFRFFSTGVNVELVIWILGGIIVFSFLIFYATYRYRRWRRFREFEDEMKSLDLNREQEGTLAGMVKRYQVGEPVQILYSAKMFDDLATAEMRRILASQGSAEAKEKFINSIYEIRTRTYHPDWVQGTSGASASRSSTGLF